MANQQQYIPCPDCGSKIFFEPYELIKGAKFACPKCCVVSIGLDQGSVDTVKNSLEQFEKFKKKHK